MDNNEMSIIKLFHQNIQMVYIFDQKFSCNIFLKAKHEVNSILTELGLKNWLIKYRENTIIGKMAILTKAAMAVSK